MSYPFLSTYHQTSFCVSCVEEELSKVAKGNAEDHAELVDDEVGPESDATRKDPTKAEAKARQGKCE